jgi:hypothetical protein
MRVSILKYPLTQLLDTIVRVERGERVQRVRFEQFMPEGSVILHVREQHDLPTMWVSSPVDDVAMVERRFAVFSTGL